MGIEKCDPNLGHGQLDRETQSPCEVSEILFSENLQLKHREAELVFWGCSTCQVTRLVAETTNWRGSVLMSQTAETIYREKIKKCNWNTEQNTSGAQKKQMMKELWFLRAS